MTERATTESKFTRVKTTFGAFSGTRGTLYTCPANCRSRIISLFAEAASGTDVTVTIEIFKNDVSTYFKVTNEAGLTKGQPTNYASVDIILEAGDLYVITAGGSAPQVDAFVTVEETFKPNG